jgi:hypothetical protein
VSLVYTREGWTPPWREGLAHAACVACGRVVVEITRTRGHCKPCTVKLGVAPEVFEPEQLEIPLF